jgi:ABC-type Fe3+/spermidine/putrescine transport system ATPase subunit
MAWLELRSVAKRFGVVTAIERIDLEVGHGEFLTLLGASGCGKSTTLRIIAGLERPDEGEVILTGRPIQDMPVHRREIAMVFQSYALFPHMTVAQNVAFGLETRGVATVEIGRRVREALKTVELSGLDERYPRQLSGGQQQRVALARALVTEPKVLLLDEPLSNLDAKLRDRLRVELRALQQKLQVTTIYVTHDQGEAMSLSDRIAFMAGGRIVEIGTPEEIYRRPRARSTAEFLGIANMLDGKVVAAGQGILSIESNLGRLDLEDAAALSVGDDVVVCLRPEDIRLVVPEAGAPNGLPGTIRHSAYLGSITDYIIEPAGSDVSLRIHVPGPTTWRIGDIASIQLPRFGAVIRRRPIAHSVPR